MSSIEANSPHTDDEEIIELLNQHSQRCFSKRRIQTRMVKITVQQPLRNMGQTTITNHTNWLPSNVRWKKFQQTILNVKNK